MKTNHINKLARFVGMTVAIAWLAGIAGAANAQNGAKGGPSKLLELRGRGITPKTEKPSDHQTMSCAKCTDKIIQVRDTDSKGGARALVSGAPLTKSIARHGCDACGTDWAVVGIGRAKQSVATPNALRAEPKLSPAATPRRAQTKPPKAWRGRFQWRR